MTIKHFKFILMHNLIFEDEIGTSIYGKKILSKTITLRTVESEIAGPLEKVQNKLIHLGVAKMIYRILI